MITLAALLATAACSSGPEADEPTASDDGDAQEQGETIELTIGAGHPAGGALTYTTWAQEFFVPELVRRVEEETPHTLEVQEAYGGTIAGLDEVMDATSSGLLDIGLIDHVFEPSDLMLHNFGRNLPFGPTDPSLVVEAGRATYEANPEMLSVFEEDWNQRLLAIYTTGSYGVVTSFDWDEVDDLEGRNLAGAGANLKWLAASGANPIQGSLNEWYNGIQTGVYDGAVIFPGGAAGYNLHEVAPYFTVTGFGALLAGSLNVNLDTFEGLPADVQEILLEVAAEYEAGFGEAQRKADEEALERMVAEGGTLKELSADQRAVWAEQLPDVAAEAATELNDQGKAGSKVISDYIDLLAEAGHEFPREWDIP